MPPVSTSLAAQAGAMSLQEPALPPLLSLTPTLAATHILSRLPGRCRAQLSLACKQTHAMALASIKQMTVSDYKLIEPAGSSGGSTAPAKLQRHYPGCRSLTLRPRTMEDLSHLVAALLVGRPLPLPYLTALRLELGAVYAKQCDLSLTLKSVALRCRGLTRLHLEQAATYSAKEAAAIAELPALAALQLVSTRGWEPGALGHLGRLTGLTHLHLQLIDEDPTSTTSSSSTSSSSGFFSSSSTAAAHAVDAAALKGLTSLTSITVVGMRPPTSPSAPWAVECLLQAASTAAALASISKPQPQQQLLQQAGPLGVQQLRLMECGPLTPALMEVVSRLHTLVSLSLGEVSDPGSLVTLSRLTALQGLALAPQLLPPAALQALLSGCTCLARLLVGSLGAAPSTAAPGIHMQQLQLVRCTGTPASAAATSSSAALLAAAHPSTTVATRRHSSSGGGTAPVAPPAAVASVPTWFQGLRVLAITGWSLDGPGVAAVCQLRQLSHLLLNPAASTPTCQQEGDTEESQPAAAQLSTSSSSSSSSQPADVLLPLLCMPSLRQLQLLGLTGLVDSWIAQVMSSVGTPGGSLAGVTHLGLGAAPDPTSLRLAAAASASSKVEPAKSASAAAAVAATMAANAVFEAANVGLTDKGLVKLFAAPVLTKLELVNLHGISLAGIKALCRGCTPLRTVVVRGVPGVAAAPAEALLKAGVAGPDRVVDVLVAQ